MEQSGWISEPGDSSLRNLDLRGGALALLLSALWGGNPAAIKIGLFDAPPFRLGWMRFVLGGLSILAWAWWTGTLAHFRIERHEWRPLAFLGVLFTVQVGCLNLGTAFTTASHSALLLNAYAVHTVLLAHFLIPGDRLTPRKLGGALVAYAGIVILFARQLGGSGATLLGDVIVSFGAVLLAERTIYLAQAVQRIDPTKLLLAQAVIGSAGLAALSLGLEAGTPYRWTASLALSIFYQGVVVAGFNFIANLWLLMHYRPSALAGFWLTSPIFGVLLSALFVGDPLTGALLLASLLVAIGIGLTSRPA
ncbi:MAG: DMT family transporter [Candidatus Rokubacteria bacterium]|nr:DMT family transporter [Candidatus Rokubacteria bacterium]